MGLLIGKAASTEFASGSGTEEDPYLIATKEHLNNVRNHLDAHYEMISDIVFTDDDFANGTGWEPIGYNQQNSFSGVFSGNGHTISGLKISISTSELWTNYSVRYVGLFGYATGIIRDISLKDVTNYIYDHYHDIYVGGLAGYSTAPIVNVSVIGEIRAESGTKDVYVGGVAGVNSASIINAYFDGVLTGTTQGIYVLAGGITAQSGAMESCKNDGSVAAYRSTHSYAGGISGKSNRTIRYCYNNGGITGNYAGGISGYDGKISYCYNTGSVSSRKYAGGICGYMLSGSIFNCYNIGSVNSSDYGGGIIGQLYSGGISCCYNLGNISASSYGGSIAGGNHGTVYSSDLIEDGGTISNCYYPDSHKCGVGRGKGIATSDAWEDLKKESSYRGFDFTSIWTMSGNSYYSFPELIDNEMMINPISFEITKLPTKTQYLEGKDSLNLSGAKGKISYSNSFEDSVPLSVSMVKGFNNSVVGKQILTVEYAGFTDTFEIQILEKSLVSIAVTKLPSKTQYLESYDILNVSGGQITLEYNNNTSSQLDLIEDMVTGFDNNIVGPQQLTVTYSGKTTTFDIEIIKKSISRISLETIPSKTKYIGAAESIDTTGGSITVFFNNGTTEQVDITPEMISGFNNRILGKQTLTITYQGLTLNYEIEVGENTLDFDGGIGTKENPFIVSNVNQLNRIRAFSSDYFLLSNDIIIADIEYENGGLLPNGWVPFVFNGTLNGNGFSIKNLKIDSNLSHCYNPGLFTVNNGKINNLIIEDSTVYVSNYTNQYGGFLVAENNGTITNCHSKKCAITLGNANPCFGCIAGKNTGDIQNCTSNNNIDWQSIGGRVGGIASNNSGTIENCTNWTIIVNTGAYAQISGGIVAENSGTILSSKNLADILAKTTASSNGANSGGIVGKMTGGNISQCYNAGDISAEATQYKAYSIYVGGIVANITAGTISDCYNTANMHGQSKSTSSSTYVGGIIGYNSTIGYIHNCYTIGGAYGSASASKLFVGYVCGYNSTNTIDNCYYLGIADYGSGSGDMTNIYGKGISELKESATYTGFDFDSIWTMSGNKNYPFPEITATPMVYDKEIKYISIETMPKQLTYIQNYETLNLDGGFLKITYAYDEYEIIPLSEATVSGFDNSVLGMKNITVTYLNYTTDFEIEIVEKSLERIEVTTLPNKITYYEGDAFVADGLVVVAHYNDRTSEPINKYSLSGFSPTPGTKTIIVQYQGKTATFDVSVIIIEIGGDANGDGTVDIEDAMLVFYHVAKKSTLSDDRLPICDTNADGEVDIEDAMTIFYFVAKKIDKIR